MRGLVLVSPLACLACALGRADVADALRQGTQAAVRHDLKAATDAFRRALEAEKATDKQRHQALDGLFQVAVEARQLANLTTYIEHKRQTKVPWHLRRVLDEALLRSYKARDGHCHRAIDALTQQAKDPNNPRAREAQRAADTLRSLCSRIGHDGEQQARAIRYSASRIDRFRQGRPSWRSRRSARRVALSPPQRPLYTPRPIRLTPTPRHRRSGETIQRLRERLRTPRPSAPRMPYLTALAVKKPPYRRPTVARIATAFLSQAYRRSRDLAAQGLVETAKAELAAVIVLFPRTEQAVQAARYAQYIFRRQFGAGQQARMLVAYLKWIRAAAGPHGLEYAEYLAIQSFSTRAPADIVAREAQAFLQRYPESKYLAAVRLQLALALERQGQIDPAIAALQPAVDAPDSKTRSRILLVLAWLHIFKGQVAQARPLLQKAVAHAEAPAQANVARRLLEETAAEPPNKTILPSPLSAEEATETFAARLLDAGDHFRRDGDHERAMDLYSLFLRVAADLDDYSVHRDRIARFRETGRMDE